MKALVGNKAHRPIRLASPLNLPDRQISLIAADIVNGVLPLWYAHHPEDRRPRKMVEIAENYGLSGVKPEGVVGIDIEEGVGTVQALVANAARQAACTIFNAYAIHSVVYFASRCGSSIDAAFDWMDDLYLAANPGVPFDPRWATKDVVAIVEDIIRTRDFSSMPVLADALADAGCDDAVLDTMRKSHYTWGLSNWAVFHVATKASLLHRSAHHSMWQGQIQSGDSWKESKSASTSPWE